MARRRRSGLGVLARHALAGWPSHLRTITWPAARADPAGGPAVHKHRRALHVVSGRCRSCPVGPESATALRQGRGLGGGRGLFLTGAVDAGKAAAWTVPPFPGGPAGRPGKPVPAD